MQPPKNSDFPDKRLPLENSLHEHTNLRFNLAQEMIGWRKYKPLFLAIREKVLIGVLCVVSIPFLPIMGFMYILDLYKKYKHKAAVKNGILPSELSASQKTTVYLSGKDVSGFCGRTDIEYSQSAEKASFNYRTGSGRYHVFGTREEGLFMLVPRHRKIKPGKFENGAYFQCDIVRVNGGYNHGDFGEKSPMGSSDCVVLVCKKILARPPSRDLVVFIASDTTGGQRIDVSPVSHPLLFLGN